MKILKRFCTFAGGSLLLISIIGVLFSLIILFAPRKNKAQPVLPEFEHTKIENIKNFKCVANYSHGTEILSCGYLKFRSEFNIWEPEVLTIGRWESQPVFVQFTDYDFVYIDVYTGHYTDNTGRSFLKRVINVPKEYNIFGN